MSRSNVSIYPTSAGAGSATRPGPARQRTTAREQTPAAEEIIEQPKTSGKGGNYMYEKPKNRKDPSATRPGTAIPAIVASAQ